MPVNPRPLHLLVLAVLALGAARPPQSSSGNLLLGNPSGATAEPTDRDNYLMVKPYYALSYSDSRGEPNWVSWELTKADLGHAPRKQVFDADTTLPDGFTRVTQRDYADSGFDLGHMCPHGDRAASQTMSDATFVMTNIIPQAPNVNRKAWEQLERYCRALASEGNHLYIVAGPLGQGGVGSHGEKKELADKVTVPAECWKVIVVVPEAGADDLAKINVRTRVIAVDVPNTQAVGEDWTPYRVSVAAIEKKTGLHFFGAAGRPCGRCWKPR